MAKVIKLDLEEVVIADEEKNILRVPYEELDFKPELHDEVDIFEDNDQLIVTKSKKKSTTEDDKIHINIVNDNTQQQTNMNHTYVQAGKVVNKVAYVVLALFLGSLGIHKFYAGKTGAGVMYILFCWTGIPGLIAFFSGIMAALKPADANGNIIV